MRKSEYKAHIDAFISGKWNFLNTCAKNIMKGKKLSPDDLLGELAIYLYGAYERLAPYIQNDTVDYKDITAFSLSWMKLQAQFTTTPFSRTYTPKARGEEMPDLACEAQPESVEDEYIKDLRSIYTDDQVEKIMKIHDIYPTLSETHKILFRAYFLENLSYDKIRMKYDFFRTDKNGKRIYYKSKKSIYNLMMELKEEINKRL